RALRRVRELRAGEAAALLAHVARNRRIVSATPSASGRVTDPPSRSTNDEPSTSAGEGTGASAPGAVPAAHVGTRGPPRNGRSDGDSAAAARIAGVGADVSPWSRPGP